MKRIIFAVFVLLSFFPRHSFAQDFEEPRQTDAVITAIDSQENDQNLFHYRLEVQTDADETFTVFTQDSHPSGIGYKLQVGDKVILEVIEKSQGTDVYFVDIHREKSLLLISLFFVSLIVIVGLWRGLFSLLGLGLTIYILFFFLLPKILQGADPLFTTILASIAILCINIPLSHGLRRQSFCALAGSLAGLGLVVLFTKVFLELGRLSGMASEEASLLFWELEGLQLPLGILASGIILGAVGVLDDVAIAQAEIVDELVLAKPHISRKELFTQAMRVGRHHIASTVNTLVLVYAGAALPIFLLFLHNSISAMDFLTSELVAEEIIRTLAGTSALILTVPLSTWFATFQQPLLTQTKKGSNIH